MSAQQLRDRIGGKWDGGGREIHGLVDWGARTVKFELMRTSDGWLATAFCDGAAVATERGPQTIALVESILRQLER